MATELPHIDEHRFVIIIGAGASGILQACELLRKNILPHEEFAILDRYKEFGGCWVQNTYPGCACDTMSHVYEVSWHRNPDWKRNYSTQAEIKEYYGQIAREHQLERSTHFETEVLEARWLDRELKWLLTVRDLRKPAAPPLYWTCTFLITALGPFTIPKKIPVPGVDSFEGASWHAFNWPADWKEQVADKRVAVVGTGPSACQFIPHVQKEAKSLTVYQRNAGSIWKRNEKPFPAWVRWTFRNVPFVLRFYSYYLKQLQEIFIWYMVQKNTWWQNYAISLAHNHVKEVVTDPEKREKLMPRDQFGCKRPMFLDAYYPALDQPNVDIVTDPITEITPEGIISKNKKDDDVEYENKVDVLIWGTGYHLEAPGAHIPIYGRGGKELKEHYGREQYCLYGITVDEFPNMANFIGPYSVGYWTPFIEQIELTAGYNGQMVKFLLEANRSSFNRALMLKRVAAVDYVESIREDNNKLVASMESCVTYYKSKDGIVLNCPWKFPRVRKALSKVEFDKHYMVLETRTGMDTVAKKECKEVL